MKNLALFWEVFLALLSFLFYKVMKFIVGNLFTIYLAVNKGNASQWRVLSEEVIKSPLSLPVLMTKGPRWNTHAIIGTLGPFFAKDSIALDIKSANSSAGSWIAVVYSFPGYETITSIESGTAEAEAQCQVLQLESGKYTLGLRYYHWSSEVYLPAVKVDNVEFVKPQFVPGNVNDFYKKLAENKSWFYRSLHYYIFTILKFKKILPDSFVKREYLPVGAPDTDFFYNYIDKNQSLEIEIERPILNYYEIYFTLYNRSSFPVTWSQISEEKQLVVKAEENGFYLLRLRQKSSLVLKSSSKEHLNYQLIGENDSIQKLQIT